MPVNIHGKSYSTVNERIKAFSKEYKDRFSIETNIIKLDEGLCVIKAKVTVLTKDSNSLVYEGHAYEREASSHINKTSYIENCETSAIGRALASAGYGGDEFCSANELQNALHQQGEIKKTPSSQNKCACGAPIMGTYKQCWKCNTSGNNGVVKYGGQ